MKLIIVESPTKAKTISRFLKNGYKVKSSYGHIRDLPEKELGVDVKNDFAPDYVVPAKAKAHVKELKEHGKKADSIILATDEDREGEAIAWHIAQVLKEKKKYKRIVFHEITEKAIKNALENPRDLDMNLVDAQQARRILDRLVGYKLSPLLWRKVAKGLSAGRVQSVAVRLIVDREREIKNFKSDEYWEIEALFKKIEGEGASFSARLAKENGKMIDKLGIKNEAVAQTILKNLQNAEYKIENIERKETKKKPLPPFTTSTLQQTSAQRLRYSAKQTMRLAQQLYETGHITYMRTDSMNLSEEAISAAENFIGEKFGSNYSQPTRYKTKAKGAQEAHEAIRPTDAKKTPEELSNKLDPRQAKLYKLIWQRFIASQMAPASVDSTVTDIAANKYTFRAIGSIIKFDGFLKVYPMQVSENDLPNLETGEILELIKLDPSQHFTQPPARYGEAALIKALEKHGIGRPSTYAPIITTIQLRNYVQKDENKKFIPTEIAFIVTDLLVAHFPEIVGIDFTAKMEEDLDEIAAGKKEWVPTLKDFYLPFEETLKIKNKELNKKDIMPEEKTDEICDKCGEAMIVKTGRYGKFLACSGFPNCKNIKSIAKNDAPSKEKSEQIKELEEKHKDEKCDKCNSPMVVKIGRFGPFLACSAYPACKNIKSVNPQAQATGIACPACKKGEIVQKRSRRGFFYACNQYPDCKNTYAGKPTGEKCDKCDSLIIETPKGTKCSNKECA